MDISSLQSRVSSAYIPPHRTQLHPRMHSFNSTFASSLPKPSNSAWQSRDRYWILAGTLLVSPFVFYLFAIARGVHSSSRFSDSKPKGFGVIVHASAAGSTVRVFEFLREGRIPFVGLDGDGGGNSLKLRPGLVEFADEPQRVGDSIEELLEFARERVPKREWRGTKVRLMITGDLGAVGSLARDGILESCRKVLRSSVFSFKDEWASEITGQDEGIYAWVAANYALGTLGGDPYETTGVVELGRASAQVTLVLREPPQIGYSKILKLAGVSYNIYSKSMLHFGQDAAWKSLGKMHNSRVLMSLVSSEDIEANPCIPKGYNQISNTAFSLTASTEKLPAFHAAGNFSACRSEVLTLLQKQDCLDPPCQGVSFMPKFQGKSLSPDSFFYTSELFGLVRKASLSDIEAAGQHYCEGDWATLKDEHKGIDEADLLRYCFSSAYIVALLHDGLGIPMDDKRIGFTNHAAGPPLDWTLGAFIFQTMMEPEPDSENLAHIVGDDSVTYLSLFAILFLAIVAAFYISKWRKPQLKTVYDLEKGRYIITRVPR